MNKFIEIRFKIVKKGKKVINVVKVFHYYSY